MSDFHERLRAADPAAGMSYRHPDLEAMISRIETRAPLARRHVLRSFQLKMAGAATLAAVLTVGGIAAIEGAGSALQVLALSAVRANATPTHATTPKALGGLYAVSQVPRSGIMHLYEEFDFTAGPDLSANAGTGAAYQLQFPTSASTEAARLATIFNVAATPADTNGDGSDWTVTDPAGDTLDYESYGGVAQWYYNVAPSSATSVSTSNGATVSMPSASRVDRDLDGYLGQMNYGYRVSDPQFSTSTTTSSSPGQPSVTTSEETAGYSVTVDGMVTDQNVEITVDSNNNLVSMSGPAFTLQPAVQYPLQSPVAGVAVLEAQQQSEFSSGSGGPGIAVPLSSGSNATPTTIPSGGATTTITPPIVNVTLDAVSTSLQSYGLTDGSVWLLSLYTYTGNVTNTNGSSYTGSWSTIAIDPTYVQLPISSTGSVNPGGPLMH